MVSDTVKWGEQKAGGERNLMIYCHGSGAVAGVVGK
jgi:hypothetical protein